MSKLAEETRNLRHIVWKCRRLKNTHPQLPRCIGAVRSRTLDILTHSSHPHLPCTAADAPFISSFARSIEMMTPTLGCNEINPFWDKRHHRSIYNGNPYHSLPSCLWDNQINAHVSSAECSINWQHKHKLEGFSVNLKPTIFHSRATNDVKFVAIGQ